MDWMSGRMSGRVSVPLGGTLNLAGNAGKQLYSDDPAFPAALTNLGVVSWSGQPLTLANATRLINGNSGTWRLEADGSPFKYAGGPASLFINRGLLTKGLTSDTAVIDSCR